jgi:hypothetical protein
LPLSLERISLSEGSMNEFVINLLQFTFIHPTKMKASDKHSDLSLTYGMEVVVRIYCSQI